MSGQKQGKNVAAVLSEFRQKAKEQAVTIRDAPGKTTRKAPAKPRAPSKAGGKAADKLTSIEKAKPKLDNLKNSLAGKTKPVDAIGKAAQAPERQPVAGLIKKVVLHLEKVRTCQDAKDILEKAHVDVMADQELFESLKDNPKITYAAAEGTFTYKAKYSLKDKAGLLEFVRKFPDGTHAADLKDAYKGVSEDLQALKAAGDVYILWSADTQDDVVFPVDTEFKNYKVDEDLVAAYKQADVPTDTEDLEEELRKAGIKPTERRAPRRRVEKVKEKKKRDFRARKITNTHMMHLFKNEQPKQID